MIALNLKSTPTYPTLKSKNDQDCTDPMNPFNYPQDLFSKEKMKESIPYSECLSFTPEPLKETRADTRATTVPDFLSPNKKKEFGVPCLKCQKIMRHSKSLNSIYTKDVAKCNGCGKNEFVQVKGILHCDSCCFDLCRKCRFCPQGHFLKKVYEFDIEGQPKVFHTYPKNSFKCDICDEILLQHLGSYRCWTCSYDICNTCMRKSRGE